MDNNLNQTDKLFRIFQIAKFNQKSMVPTVAMTINIETEQIMKKRLEYKKDTTNPHITITNIIMKAVADTLIQYPSLYSYFDGKKIIENEDVVLNIPVDTGKHVEYIVIRQANKKNLTDIAKESIEERKKIADGKGDFAQYIINLMKKIVGKKPSDQLNDKDIRKIEKRMQYVRLLEKVNPNFSLKFVKEHYGNFPVSNFGSFHIPNGILALSKPVVAGLCIGEMNTFLKMKEKEIVAVEYIPLTLSFDHRVFDGAYAGNFLNDLKDLLENSSEMSTHCL